MKRLATLFFATALGLMACASSVSAEFGTNTLSQLQQLNHKPELYLTGPGGDFLITADTRVEIYLTGGEVVTAYAAEILTTADSVVLRGRGATIPLNAIARVRYTSTY